MSKLSEAAKKTEEPVEFIAAQDGSTSFSVGEEKSFLQQRLHSLDAYRGLIMITLAFTGFGIAKTADLHLAENPTSQFWTTAKFHFSHVEWLGCGYWDMVQPSFMFMVGVSMAYSYVRRKREGHSYLRMLCHAAWRSVVLILLGIFLISNFKSSTNWSLMNVLTQIGMGYTFLFLLWERSFRTQVIVASLVLIGTWASYVLWQDTGIADVEKGNEAVGVTAEWAQANLKNISPAWHKGANAGHFIDVWLLNLFPLVEPFEFNKGGYVTINFIPSLATMLFGLMAGELLRSERSGKKKLLILLLAGIIGIGLGYVLEVTGVCPMIKRIWTPSWTLFSSGTCSLILATLYLCIDLSGLMNLKGLRWIVFPLTVVGVNSIAIYCMSMLLKPWVKETFSRHFGENVFLFCGELYEPMVLFTLTGFSFWIACFWMYRQKIYVRV